MENDWQLPLRVIPTHTKKDESIVWNTSHLCYEQKLFGQVTSLSYNHSGTMLGTTSTNQLAILRVPQSEGVIVNEQTERKNFSIRFRIDDKLYVQSIDQRVVVKSAETAFERQFMGHTREVRAAIFLGKHNFASASDDTTIKLWDLLSENELGSAQVHTDYVRCLENYSSSCFFSGSYDHSVNLWDPRVGMETSLQSTGKLLSAAVETLCSVEETGLLACGCGDQIVLFDIRKGLSSPLSQGSFHTKTVVSLAYSARHQALLSASLDCRMKLFVLDKAELRCLSTKKFDHSLTAVAVQPQGGEFVVGMTTGDVRVFKLEKEPANDEGGKEMGHVASRRSKAQKILHEKTHMVQHHLRTYQYSKAIKTALYTRHADILMSIIEELIRRGALHVALSSQNDRTMARLLRFATEHLDKPQFTDTMLEVFEVILEIYSITITRSIFFHHEMMVAQKKVAASLATLKRMEGTISTMELILNASNV